MPVDIDWVVGKARGESPWCGLLKLWVTDSLGSEAPENSVHNLWISIAVIVVVPITIDVVLTYKIRKKIARKREAAQRACETEMMADRARADAMAAPEEPAVDLPLPDEPGPPTPESGSQPEHPT